MIAFGTAITRPRERERCADRARRAMELVAV